MIRKSKLQIIWSMRSWSLSYINWRLITAYPSGWKFIFIHPFKFIVDFWHYLCWCQEIDESIN